MTEQEKNVREYLGVQDKILKKLDLIRNEIKPLYGENITIKEVEELLWNQYLKTQKLISEQFENSIVFEKEIHMTDNIESGE